MVKKICEVCGKEYYVKNYRKDISRFCSRKCQGRYTQQNVLSKVDKSYMKGNKYRVGKKSVNSFKKGHVAWNKGIKGIHLSPKTEFKKGRKSNNHKEIGVIVQRKDKKGKIRNFIKVAEPNKWELYAVYLVKKQGIIVPKGSVVHHKNKNCIDDRIENLEVLTRAQHINIHRKDLKTLDNHNQIC